MFIPKKIKIGYQNRGGTYTGKLAYVIYYDETGKVRKERSWDSWRDKGIEPDEFNNEPTSGFVLNKKVGGYSTGWNHRATYTRIFDPRGFEFEITVDNLLYILENCNSIKGKGLEGEFVYGWSGKDLILIPADSPDYIKCQEKTNLKYNAEYFKGKDLKIGLTYETLEGKQYIYLGKYNYYQEEFNRLRGRGWYSNGGVQWDELIDETWIQDPLQNNNTRSRFINKGKRFFFAKVDDSKIVIKYIYDQPLTSVSKKFYRIANENIHPRLSEMIEYLESKSLVSPVAYDKTKISNINIDEFKTSLSNAKIDDEMIIISNGSTNDLYNQVYEYWYKNKIKKLECGYSFGNRWRNRDYQDDELDKMFNDIKPIRIKRYLENGNIENVEKGVWDLYE